MHILLYKTAYATKCQNITKDKVIGERNTQIETLMAEKGTLVAKNLALDAAVEHYLLTIQELKQSLEDKASDLEDLSLQCKSYEAQLVQRQQVIDSTYESLNLLATHVEIHGKNILIFFNIFL